MWEYSPKMSAHTLHVKHEISASMNETDSGDMWDMRKWKGIISIINHYYHHHPIKPHLHHQHTQSRTHRLTVRPWASWFPYAAFRDALSHTWATWGSLGTGKSHSNSGLKICLPPSQHGLNINSFMLAICKRWEPIPSNPVRVWLFSLCPYKSLPAFRSRNTPFTHTVGQQ